MFRKSVFLMCVLVLLVSCVGCGFQFASSVGAATTWTVDDDGPADFGTIQEAINTAVDGDTIFVKTGTYYEHVTVNKSVSLVGEYVSATIIDGNDTGHVVSIIADYVNVTGFTVQKSGDAGWPALDAGFCLNGTTGCTLSENHVTDNGFCGISLLNSQQNTINGNNVTSTTWGGIHMLTSSHNTISRNALHNTYVGINGHASSHYNNITENLISNSTYGMFYHNANYNNICRNNISTIAIEGIWLQEQVNYNVVSENNLVNNTVAIRLQGPNYNNTLSRNIITGAEYGIRIQNYARYNTILQNNISQNGYGFYIDYSTQNTIQGNNIVDNDQQVYVSTGSVNNWDGGYPAGGNYWGDPTSTDLNSGPYQNITGSDGIGDTPYVIDDNNIDNYPLMKPYILARTDLNGDGIVNIQDIFIVAKAWQTKPGDENWDPRADLDGNDLVNIADLYAVAKDYGKTV